MRYCALFLADLPELDTKMELWNEYEGRSIDGLFPLERLIRPEGRSAFFSTTTSGASTVIRLIESHFDEEEILARWTDVSNLHQPNLLTLTRFGQAMMDETSLVYVVLEPTEADLSQILCERPLTVTETREVAASLIPALQALHAKGFIHEHIQPVNVLAVGEVVKLRSDCIREVVQTPEGDALRTRDVQDLATLLLQCLTLQRSHVVSPTGPPLPAPFREIIHNGISGAWSLAQMASALEATAPAPQSTKAPEPAGASPDAGAGTVQNLHRRAAPTISAPSKTSAAASRTPEAPTPRKPATLSPQQPSRPAAAAGRISVPLGLHAGGMSPRRLGVLAAALVCLVIFVAYGFQHRSANQNAADKTAADKSAATEPVAAGSTPAPATASATPVAPPYVATAAHASMPAVHESWRVVAFTYNRQDQAAAKAHALETRFSTLHPSVFAPSGRASYLVTLGGPLSRNDAFSLRDRLRRSGLPRDLYAQNYQGRSR